MKKQRPWLLVSQCAFGGAILDLIWTGRPAAVAFCALVGCWAFLADANGQGHT